MSLLIFNVFAGLLAYMGSTVIAVPMRVRGDADVTCPRPARAMTAVMSNGIMITSAEKMGRVMTGNSHHVTSDILFYPGGVRNMGSEACLSEPWLSTQHLPVLSPMELTLLSSNSTFPKAIPTC